MTHTRFIISLLACGAAASIAQDKIENIRTIPPGSIIITRTNVAGPSTNYVSTNAAFGTNLIGAPPRNVRIDSGEEKGTGVGPAPPMPTPPGPGTAPPVPTAPGPGTAPGVGTAPPLGTPPPIR